MSKDLEEIHKPLHKGAARKIGEFHWYIIKSYIVYKTRFASDVNGWRTFHTEQDVISLQARVKQAFDAAQTLKTVSKKIAREWFTSYEEMITTLESFAANREQEINKLHEFIVWLYDKDPIAPSTFLFKRPIWGATRYRNIIIDIKVNLPKNDATNVMRASDIVFGLWNQGDKFFRHAIPLETASDKNMMLDPEEWDKLATEDPLQLCVKLGIDPQQVISNVCSRVLNEFATYFECLRNSLDALLNQIENFMVQPQFSLYEEDEQKFCTEILVPLFRDLGFRDVKFTHGPDEYGKDIVFSEIDQFGVRRNYAALVKVTNISGSAEQSINEIFRQIEDAFLVPATDIPEKLERPINAIYVITSKQFTRNAKEKILRKMEAHNIYSNVYFFDGEKIKELMTQVFTKKSQS